MSKLRFRAVDHDTKQVFDEAGRIVAHLARYNFCQWRLEDTAGRLIDGAFHPTPHAALKAFAGMAQGGTHG